MRLLIPLDGDVDSRGSFAWLVDQGFSAAEGSPQRIKCPKCDYSGLFAFKKDTNAIIKLIEMVHGRAAETKDITVKDTKLIALLDGRVPLDEVKVHDISDEDVARRQVLLEETNEYND